MDAQTVAGNSTGAGIWLALAAGAIGLIILLLHIRRSRQGEDEVLANGVVAEEKVISREEVAKHHTKDDCWIILKDEYGPGRSVYDITSYVAVHPGGLTILNNAGDDSTEGFNGPQHPRSVFELIGDFRIGRLSE